MSLKTVFIINTILMGGFAYISILLPATVISGYGAEFNEKIAMTVRLSGSVLLAIALMTLFLKDSEYNSNIKSIVLALLISNIVGLIVTLWGQFSHALNNTFGWLYIIVFGFMSFSFSSIYFKK
jgi:hypothetical protein